MPSALVFARKADEGLASFAQHLDKFVGKNKDKNAKATVIMLGDKDAFSSDLEKIAKDKKLQNVPLTVSVDGSEGPKKYHVNGKTPITVVIYDNSKVVTASFAYDKIDDKAENETFKEFAKAVGCDAPKLEDLKAEPKAETPAGDAPKAEDPKKEDKKDEPKKEEPKKEDKKDDNDPMSPK